MANITRLVGLGLVGAGLAHFAKPEVFESLTASAFPTDTRQHVYTNGAIETALGVGLVLPQTRKLAVVGSLGYVGYLAANAKRNATS